MSKRDWAIVISVALVSYTLLYFKLPGPQPQPVIPQQEKIIQPEVKTPEPTEQEVKEPETTDPKLPEVVAEVPEVIVFESKKGNVTFNHSMHSKGFACTDCHHKMEEGSTPKSCKECHENTFQARHGKGSTYSCVGCHKEVGAGPSYTPCSGCHKK